MKDYEKIRQKLTVHGLKATIQRVVILDAMRILHNHPTAEDIHNYISGEFPSISLATVYKTLEAFMEKGMIKQLKTDNNYSRYDEVTDVHYHLYSPENQKLEDYYDDELHNMLTDYFSRKQIPGFEINDIKLQLIGKFKDTQ